MGRQGRADPLSRVLVATDLSEHGTWAARRAGMLPLEEGGEVTLLHVLPEGMPARLRRQAEVQAQDGLREAAEALAAAARSASRDEPAVNTVLCSGRAFVEIIRRARAEQSDLVVLGRHGVRTVRDALLGTTTRRVIRMGDLPVLVVDRRPEGPYRRPLFAVDLKDASPQILALGMRVLGPEAPTPTVLHAYNVPFEGLVSETWSSRERSDWRRQYEAEANRGLERLLEPWRERRDWSTVLRPGEPRLVIRNELQRRRSDLVVLGTHARRGLAHALVGSVAEWIIDVAPCDVLVGRPTRFSFELP